MVAEAHQPFGMVAFSATRTAGLLLLLDIRPAEE
jgi:hypothetical protein